MISTNVDKGVDNRSLLEQEYELENHMRKSGIDKFIKEVEKAKARGQEGTTMHGIMLMKHSVDKVSEGINEFIKKASKGQAEQGFKIAPMIAMVDPQLSAFLTIKTVINSISTVQSFVAITRTLGQIVEDEIKFQVWKDKDSKMFKILQEKMTKHTASRHYRRYGLIKRCKKYIEVEDARPFSTQEKHLIGSKLLDILVKTTGLVEVRTMTHGRKKKNILVCATKETIEWIEKVNNFGQVLAPNYLPMITTPKRWETIDDGGYYTFKLPMIKTQNKHFLRSLRSHDMPLEYECINSLQETEWCVNTKVLDVMSKMWESHINWKGLPNRNPLDIPPCPAPPGVQKKDMSEEMQREFLNWKTDASSVYNENARRFSKVLQLVRTIGMAREMNEYDKFHFVYQSDFRGRKYTVSSFLTPQGPEYAKGLLLFAKGEPIETDEQADWLAIHGANCFGIDKVPFEDRIKWVDDHAEQIIASAQDPLSFVWWNEAEDPWLFLAFCFEWNEFLEQGFGYKSRIPVQLDGSNNGLQNFSAMLRDPIGGKATNLLPSDTPQDIYQDVADLVLKKVEVLAEGGERMAIQWRDSGFINRKLCKRPVMVVPYGGTRHSCRGYVLQYMRDEFNSGAPNPWAQEEFDLFLPSFWLSQILWEAIGEIVIGARECMKWIQDCSSIVAKDDKPLVWTTPTQFVVHQEYFSFKELRITTFIDGTLVKPRVRDHGSKMDGFRNRNGSAPNFVHSLDASHLTYSIHKCNIYGIKDYSMIHDSYGVHARYVPDMAHALRKAFVEMYEENDVITNFRGDAEESVGLPMPDPPERGNLDIDSVIGATYFFA